MMLWYKAWCESRARFLLIAVFWTAYCANFVLHGEPAVFGISYTNWIGSQIYVDAALYFFILFVPQLLSMGGLLAERGRGTAALSVSLPVTRLQILCVRATVGLLQIGAIALIPAILVPTLSPLAHQSYPFPLALHFALLWIVCGSAVFTMSLLLSTILSNGYTALTASFIVTLVYEYITTVPSLRPKNLLFNLSMIMAGTESPVHRFNKIVPGYMRDGLPDRFHWATLIVVVGVSVAFFAASARITSRQDF